MQSAKNSTAVFGVWRLLGTNTVLELTFVFRAVKVAF